MRILMALLSLALAACSTTSTIDQPLPPQAPVAHVYSYAFENHNGEDIEGIAKLDRAIHAQLLRAGMVAQTGEAADGRMRVELTHYYVRSNAARFWAGILAGRDKIASRVTLRDAAGTELGSFEVETTNLSAWGSTEGLMDRHAEEIAARCKGLHDPSTHSAVN